MMRASMFFFVLLLPTTALATGRPRHAAPPRHESVVPESEVSPRDAILQAAAAEAALARDIASAAIATAAMSKEAMLREAHPEAPMADQALEEPTTADPTATPVGAVPPKQDPSDADNPYALDDSSAGGAPSQPPAPRIGTIGQRIVSQDLDGYGAMAARVRSALSNTMSPPAPVGAAPTAPATENDNP